jgi:hypothetical protein
MSTFVLAQITRIGTREIAEAAFVRFLTVVQCTDVGLQLRMCGCSVTTAVADVWPLAGVSALVVVLGLICGKSLVTVFVAACVWTVAGMTEKVARELGTLLEVLS